MSLNDLFLNSMTKLEVGSIELAPMKVNKKVYNYIVMICTLSLTQVEREWPR
jgi:hypothetical protein